VSHCTTVPHELHYGRQVNSARSQSRFQVRFDWGQAGLSAIGAGAHVVVWVDVLPPLCAIPDGQHALLRGTVGNREATAHWILELQSRLADRAVVAVVAAGDRDGRFAVEDFLAAGAVIDALAEVGIDFTSPEAASAAAAFAGLRNATGHLLSASVAGQEVGPDGVAAAKLSNTDKALDLVREWL
jgi:2-phosphosulfolactate phosphatase